MTGRYKIVRLFCGFPQYMPYIGPKYGWSKEFSLAVRYVHRRKVA